MTKEKKKNQNGGLDFFSKYLTVWVAICIVVGVIIGQALSMLQRSQRV